MPASWLSQADERILEFFEEEKKASAEEMSNDERVSLNQNYITQRLQILLKSGLLERRGRGLYRITEKGIAFLAGQEDLRDEPDPE
jgi:predicted transcriptional regulator